MRYLLKIKKRVIPVKINQTGDFKILLFMFFKFTGNVF